MARTRCVRILPPREVYEAQARSAAQVAAGVPPSQRQFERAFDYDDEATVLDFLRLSPSIPRDMKETNTLVVQLSRLPLCYQSSFEVPTDSTDVPDPFLWFWPFRRDRKRTPKSLCEFAARRGFADVIAWLFCARERVARIGSVLARVFPETLRAAIYGRHVDIIDSLLTSPVFVKLLSRDKQQWVLEDALCEADHETVWDVLVAHGANIAGMDGRHVIAGIGRLQLFVPGPVDEQLRTAVWRHSQGGRARGQYEDVVVCPSIFLDAAARGDADAVKTLLAKGFVDVDARGAQNNTALLACARAGANVVDGHREVVRCLLDAGADATLRNAAGHTPLHVAVAGSKLACVEALLAHAVAAGGAEAVHGDLTALSLALQTRSLPGQRHKRVMEALLAHGACLTAFVESVRARRLPRAVCADPLRCRRQRKRRRDDADVDADAAGVASST